VPEGPAHPVPSGRAPVAGARPDCN